MEKNTKVYHQIFGEGIIVDLWLKIYIVKFKDKRFWIKKVREKFLTLSK